MNKHHTPGPWSATIYGGWDTARVFSDSGQIALVQHHESGTGEGEANARLIAAAPDMLAALETLIASLEWEEKRSGTTYNGFDTARRAIAKAKGE